MGTFDSGKVYARDGVVDCLIKFVFGQLAGIAMFVRCVEGVDSLVWPLWEFVTSK